MKPVTHSDGSLHQFTIQVAGTRFRCECGCNVFHKPDDTQPGLYQCNCCEARYRGDDSHEGEK